MKSAYLCNQRSLWRFIAVSLFCAVIISGCGSNAFDVTIAGVGSGGTGTLSGAVADGYLINATVFLDKNGNYQFDAGEPNTTTDTNGAYTLNVDPADVGKYPIVAFAIKGIAIDKDTNQSIGSTYVLSISKDSINGTVSNFISPMSSIIRELMESGQYTSVQQAADALINKLGLPAVTDMMGDYIHANNTAIHTAAQNMATLMGNQMGQVIGMNGSTITVDVNRYRAMMGLMYNNMSSSWCNSQFDMGNFSNSMTEVLSSSPATPEGQPYWNMSTAYSNMKGGPNAHNWILGK